MARRMIIIRPRPQGRALDIHGKMIRTGEIGEFADATIAARSSWFAPAPEPPKPKRKRKAKPKAEPKADTVALVEPPRDDGESID